MELFKKTAEFNPSTNQITQIKTNQFTKITINQITQIKTY